MEKFSSAESEDDEGEKVVLEEEEDKAQSSPLLDKVSNGEGISTYLS